MASPDRVGVFPLFVDSFGFVFLPPGSGSQQVFSFKKKLRDFFHSLVFFHVKIDSAQIVHYSMAMIVMVYL